MPSWALLRFAIVEIGIIFGQTLGYDFADFDDNDLVFNNLHRPRWTDDRLDALGGSGTDRFGEWHPLAIWSHMLDCQLYGLGPVATICRAYCYTRARRSRCW